MHDLISEFVECWWVWEGAGWIWVSEWLERMEEELWNMQSDVS